MADTTPTRKALLAEIVDLRSRLQEANEVLRAIRSGETDALIVSGAEGHQVFTLKSVDEPYRVFIEEMNDGAATLSVDGMILYCNRRFAEIVKMPMERVTGAFFHSFLRPEDRPTLSARLRAAQSIRGDWELTIQAADQTAVPLHLALNPLPAGFSAAVCIVVTNLTERKGKEDELRRLNDELLARTSALSRSVQELEASRIAAFNMMEDAMEAKSELATINDDLRLQIAERTRAEEMLRERDQLLQNLSSQIPGMIYTFLRRPDGRYAMPYCSSVIKEIFGIAPQDVYEDAAPIFAAIIPEDRPGVAASIEESARTMAIWQQEYRVQLPGRPVRWMWGRSQPFRLVDGSILWFGFNTDVTERKEAEERLAESLREKELLLKEIHHRVKNNLAVISGLLTLQAGQTEDERLARMVQESQSRIWTMALIHQTLYQSGDLAGIDMADYLHTLIGNLLSSQARLAMPPSCRYDVEPLRLPIDQAIPLALIANELLTNALKHAFPDGRPGEIRVSLRRLPLPEAGQCELVVADDGIGLPPDFDPDGQKHLGLLLIAMLARQIRGTLACEQDNGARFRIRFPLQERRAP